MMTTPAWQTWLFAAAAIVTISVNLLFQPDLIFQLLMLIPAIVVLGLPHGALDLSIAQALWPLIGWQGKTCFVGAYVGLTLLVIGFWIVFPGPALDFLSIPHSIFQAIGTVKTIFYALQVAPQRLAHPHYFGKTTWPLSLLILHQNQQQTLLRYPSQLLVEWRSFYLLVSSSCALRSRQEQLLNKASSGLRRRVCRHWYILFSIFVVYTRCGTSRVHWLHLKTKGTRFALQDY